MDPGAVEVVEGLPVECSSNNSPQNGVVCFAVLLTAKEDHPHRRDDQNKDPSAGAMGDGADQCGQRKGHRASELRLGDRPVTFIKDFGSRRGGAIDEVGFPRKFLRVAVEVDQRPQSLDAYVRTVDKVGDEVVPRPATERLG